MSTTAGQQARSWSEIAYQIGTALAALFLLVSAAAV